MFRGNCKGCIAPNRKNIEDSFYTQIYVGHPERMTALFINRPLLRFFTVYLR